jgi:hypothetical protein
MTRQLYRISDATLWPYPRPDDGPVEGLDRTVYRVVEIVQLPEPQHDPATEQLTPTETIDWLPDAPDATGLDGTLTRGWAVSPVDPPQPPPPAADWLGFAGWLYGFPPMAVAMADARSSTDPQGEPATTGLPAAMDEARLRDNFPPFALSWGQFLAASALAPTDLAEIVAKATACNLPAPFIAALQPAQP